MRRNGCGQGITDPENSRHNIVQEPFALNIQNLEVEEAAIRQIVLLQSLVSL